MSPNSRDAQNSTSQAAGLDTACDWAAENRFAHSTYLPDGLVELKGDTTAAVVIPAREVAGTIGRVVDAAVALREAGAIDEVIVVDAGSSDGSAEIAAQAGATVHQEDDLMPEFGPALGKGDAMWRALSTTEADVVAYVDSDTEGFGAHFIRGLIGPLYERPDLHLIKGAYRRPFTDQHARITDGGGRVSELAARPLLNLYYPELAALQQPLSGELAARRDALAQISFATGYGVEIQMLIDIYERYGLDAIAQVDLGVRINPHQPLPNLGAMAFTVLRVVAARTGDEERAAAANLYLSYREGIPDVAESELAERPPLATLVER